MRICGTGCLGFIAEPPEALVNRNRLVDVCAPRHDIADDRTRRTMAEPAKAAPKPGDKPAEKPAAEVDALEEDDEFEEFEQQEWTLEERDAEDTTMWQDGWEDDEDEDDFTQHLRTELQKTDVASLEKVAAEEMQQ